MSNVHTLGMGKLMSQTSRLPARAPGTSRDDTIDAPSGERQRRGLEVLASLAVPVSAAWHGRRAEQRAEQTGGRVIVVIPAHNEAATVGSTLRSMAAQTLPPDEVVVVCDNCTDDTADVSRRAGANRIITTVGNTARKAGALNQALAGLLPQLAQDDLVLIMDADSQLSRDWIRAGVAALRHSRRIGGVCGTYLGEPAPGLVCQLQRNEFVRASRLVPRRSSLWVLSGTGTMFRASVLREVARERGKRLPGRPGEYYDSSSITEDYEITLALKTLGFRCLVPPGCTAETELMPTWRLLYLQRLRWQSGTLTSLRCYGITRATWSNWARQAFFYLRYGAQVVCWVILIWSLVAHLGLDMPPWVAAMLAIVYAERIITVRQAGLRGVLLAMLLLPEWVYGMFDGLYLLQALKRELTGGTVSWDHVARRDVEPISGP
jgi:poly-beta-1,6-N-acetyl-D-glucosamine synthase